MQKQLQEELPKLRAPGSVSDKRIPGGQSRWSQGKELDWNPVRPELVCEVRYDKIEQQPLPARHALPALPARQGSEGLHVARSQPPRRRGDPTVESLLGAA